METWSRWRIPDVGLVEGCEFRMEAGLYDLLLKSCCSSICDDRFVFYHILSHICFKTEYVVSTEDVYLNNARVGMV